MDCSTLESPLEYADCRLIAYSAPEISVLLVVIAVIIAVWKLSISVEEGPRVQTRKPLMWKLAAWLITIPGVYLGIMTIRFTFNWTSKSAEKSSLKDDPGFGL